MTRKEFDRLAEAAFEDPALDARLAELAAGDPELEARRQAILAGRNALAGAGLDPLPTGLHEQVMAAVRRAGPGESRRGSWWSLVSATVQSRPRLALGGAVAAGFALGVVALGLVLPRFGPVGPVLDAGRYGTSSTSATLPPMPPAAVTTSLEVVGARVELSVRQVEGGWGVRIEGREGTAADVELRWDPAALSLRGLRWGGAEAPAYDPGPGWVAVRVTPSTASEVWFEETVSGQGAIRARLRTPGGDREEMLRLPR